MRKKGILIIVLIAAALLLSGYIYIRFLKAPEKNDGKIPDTSPPKTEEPSIPDTPPPVVEKDPIKEQISSMSIDEKIGQMVMLGFDGYTLDENCRKMIDVYHAGGFIILGGNIESTKQLLNLVNSLKNANLNNKIPLFISVDQEGGIVDRMPEGFKRYPTNKAIGRVNNPQFSYEIGGALAQEIKAFGFNMDLAPVLDINSNPKNPVIGDRSFGAKSDVVSTLGVQTMKGIQSESIISVVKHFPGHGDTSVDSHIGLPRVDNDLNRLKSFELVPFKNAIDNGADGVMIAHILLPKIDTENPASFSKTIITDILRDQLGFNGVVITDDMTMGAIVKNYNIADAAVKSVNAGSDIILVCHGYDNETAVIDALKKAAEDGAISQERIDESVYRILKLKAKYNLNDNMNKPVNVDEINSRINTVLKTYMK